MDIIFICGSCVLLHIGEGEEAGEEGEIQLSWWTRNLKYDFTLNLCGVIKQLINDLVKQQGLYNTAKPLDSKFIVLYILVHFDSCQELGSSWWLSVLFGGDLPRIFHHFCTDPTGCRVDASGEFKLPKTSWIRVLTTGYGTVQVERGESVIDAVRK